MALGTGETPDSVSVDAYLFSPASPGVSFCSYVMGAGFGRQGAGDVDGFVLFNGSSGDILDGITDSGPRYAS